MSSKCETQIKEQVKCSCKGYNLDKLLQPNILILLCRTKLHGYLIIQALEKKKLFHGENPDPAGIYRTLKILEEKSLIQSEWDVQETGAPRRVYSITPAGKECLGSWIDTLESYQRSIDGIIDEARTILEKTEVTI
ncbi:PadR family transcriptional regulator [Acetobacterium woodii]|uniref:Transcriptional regulator n=1 Tax=Acetobacterium woodii (strain ATCC 29683 / DSM 1030 / JCM 2381 / KCTC 1655 / WB1) TaxID=931626 RepID=H6LEW0_ACEWD|nr:helix-turn-helix transcriptional regulator [Acetobacterium woodii]AFA49403.1 transcriptional regulator [Acetobacterium woodii DSM 1030]